MMYITCPFENDTDYCKTATVRRQYIPRRANVRTINKIPLYNELTLRNGRCVQYKTGYRVFVRRFRFKTAQEVSRFLHTQGRKGLYCVVRFNDWWDVMESEHIATKKEALQRAYDNLFGYAYSWAKDETVYCENN